MLNIKSVDTLMFVNVLLAHLLISWACFISRQSAYQTCLNYLNALMIFNFVLIKLRPIAAYSGGKY